MSDYLGITATRIVELLNNAKLPKGNDKFLTLLFTKNNNHLRTVFGHIAGEQHDTYTVQQRTAMLETCFVFYADDPATLLSWFEMNTSWAGPGASYSESYMFGPALVALLGAHEWGQLNHPEQWSRLHKLMPDLIVEWLKGALRSSGDSRMEMDDKWIRDELTNRLNSYFRFSVIHMPEEEKSRRAALLNILWTEYQSARKKGTFSPPSSAQRAVSCTLHAMFSTMYIDEQLPMLLDHASFNVA